MVGHTFADHDLLRCALTHPSAIEGKGPSSSYERLEFLGDSIAGYVIAEELYRRYPDLDEGGLTRIKVSLVNGSTLSAIARELGLEAAMIVGESERGTGGRGTASALEDVFEALVAAVYLDAGLDEARRFILEHLAPLISLDVAATPENPKSALQEHTQAHGEAPVYRTIAEEGPPHDRTFTVEVHVADALCGTGTGRTKKEAEAAAAASALRLLQQRRTRRKRG